MGPFATLVAASVLLIAAHDRRRSTISIRANGPSLILNLNCVTDSSVRLTWIANIHFQPNGKTIDRHLDGPFYGAMVSPAELSARSAAGHDRFSSPRSGHGRRRFQRTVRQWNELPVVCVREFHATGSPVFARLAKSVLRRGNKIPEEESFANRFST